MISKGCFQGCQVMQWRSSSRPLQSYGLAGLFLPDEMFSWALPPSETQRSLSNFHMSCFFSADASANSMWCWCVSPVLLTRCLLWFPSIPQTCALPRTPHSRLPQLTAELFCAGARSGCSATPGGCSVCTHKSLQKVKPGDADLYSSMWKTLNRSAELLLFITQKWQYQVLVLSGEKDP